MLRLRTRPLALAAPAVAGALVALAFAIAAAPGATRERPAALPPGVEPNNNVVYSRPWTLKAIRDGGRVIVISYSAGACWGGAHARVTQGRASVTIALLQARTVGIVVACPQYLTNRRMS